MRPGPSSRAVQSFSRSRKSRVAYQVLITFFSFHLKSQMRTSPSISKHSRPQAFGEATVSKTDCAGHGEGFYIQAEATFAGDRPERTGRCAVRRCVGAASGARGIDGKSEDPGSRRAEPRPAGPRCSQARSVRAGPSGLCYLLQSPHREGVRAVADSVPESRLLPQAPRNPAHGWTPRPSILCNQVWPHDEAGAAARQCRVRLGTASRV